MKADEDIVVDKMHLHRTARVERRGRGGDTQAEADGLLCLGLCLVRPALLGVPGSTA